MGTFSDERISRILMGRKAVTVYQFPGTRADPFSFGVRALSESEYDTARAQAQTHLEFVCRRASRSEEDFLKADSEFIKREVVRQCLAAACMTEDGTKPFFESVSQVRSLDSSTVSRLWDLYSHHEENVNPLVSLDAAGIEELKAALKKGLATGTLLDFERGTLVSLLRTLVSP